MELPVRKAKMLETAEKTSDAVRMQHFYRLDERASGVVLPMAYQMTLYSQRVYSGSGQQRSEITTVRSTALSSGFVSHSLSVSQQIPITEQLSVHGPIIVAPLIEIISLWVKVETVFLFKINFFCSSFFILYLIVYHYTTEDNTIKTKKSVKEKRNGKNLWL